MNAGRSCDAACRSQTALLTAKLNRNFEVVQGRKCECEPLFGFDCQLPLNNSHKNRHPTTTPSSETIFITMSTSIDQDIRTTVQSKYAEIATKGQSCCSTSACCADSSKIQANGQSSATQFAEALGYTVKELEALPEGANSK